MDHGPWKSVNVVYRLSSVVHGLTSIVHGPRSTIFAQRLAKRVHGRLGGDIGHDDDAGLAECGPGLFLAVPQGLGDDGERHPLLLEDADDALGPFVNRIDPAVQVDQESAETW